MQTLYLLDTNLLIHLVRGSSLWVRIRIAATAAVTRSTLLTTDRDFDRISPQFIDRVWIDPDLK